MLICLIQSWQANGYFRIDHYMYFKYIFYR